MAYEILSCRIRHSRSTQLVPFYRGGVAQHPLRATPRALLYRFVPFLTHTVTYMNMNVFHGHGNR